MGCISTKEIQGWSIISKLIFAFELLRNCHIYYRIKLDQWKAEDIYDGYNKYTYFGEYVVDTAYYKNINNLDITKLFTEDLQ